MNPKTRKVITLYMIEHKDGQKGASMDACQPGLIEIHNLLYTFSQKNEAGKTGFEATTREAITVVQFSLSACAEQKNIITQPMKEHMDEFINLT